MKAAVRCRSLTLGGPGSRTLHSMEMHGKRLDATGQARRVREADPLIAGSLDLRREYDAHVAGARQNAALKRPVLHFVCQFPTALRIETEAHERWMLDTAVRFVNETHGGQAVFAARLDRDEAGRHAVDVFAAPKYEKRTKRTPADRRGETWISPTKFGKELVGKHREEIERRHKGRFSTGPRQVGIALNSEWAGHLRRLGYEIEPKAEKAAGPPDRLEPEQLKAARDAEAALDAVQERIADSAGLVDEAVAARPPPYRTRALNIGEKEWLDGIRKDLTVEFDRRREELESGHARRQAALETCMEEIGGGTCSPAPDEGMWHVHDKPRFERFRDAGRLNPGPLGWSRRLWASLRRFADAAQARLVGELKERIRELEERIERLTKRLAEEAADKAALAKRLKGMVPAAEAQAAKRLAADRQLLLAVASGSPPEAVPAALDEGASPNARSFHGWTPLHWAAIHGDVRKIEGLLGAGADPALRSDRGLTPRALALERAADEAHSPGFRRQLEQSAEILREAEPKPEPDSSPELSLSP